jgi:hypothetical protein
MTRVGHRSVWSFVLVQAPELHLEFLLAQGPDVENVAPVLPRTIDLCRCNYSSRGGTGYPRLGHKSGCRGEAEQKAKEKLSHFSSPGAVKIFVSDASF